MYLQQFFIEGLACASYLIGCDAQGVAAVIDPDRDVQPYLDAARARNLAITHVIETHLHADHVSGNTELAARTGAAIFVHEAGQVEFPHERLRDGDVVALGNVRLHVRHTPGHTPESITLLAADTTRAEEPWLAFTGDTLFVGDIGRPDLVGAEAARGLAAQMHESLLGKILPLDDGLLIYPGHGKGSLCGKHIGAMRSTTMGYERRFNQALAPRDRPAFIELATNELPEQPANHHVIKTMNRRGPRPLGQGRPRALSISETVTEIRRGALVIDLRSKGDFTAAHIPGSVHLEADTRLSNRVGFVLPPDVPLVLVVADPAQYVSAVYALARVGYDRVAGYLGESLQTWQAMGLPITSGDVREITVTELHAMRREAGDRGPSVLDVRESWEYRQGHVPGARLIPLGELQRRTGELDPRQPVAVICASGNRSESAAALLAQKGFVTVYNVTGGTEAWVRSGLPVESQGGIDS